MMQTAVLLRSHQKRFTEAADAEEVGYLERHEVTPGRPQHRAELRGAVGLFGQFRRASKEQRSRHKYHNVSKCTNSSRVRMK